MMLSRLRLKKNLILQGPPGTGKTWLAKKLAFALIGYNDNRRVRRFQFHPNLSYEDFIRGFRPAGDDGKLTLVDGPFLGVVNDARRDPSSGYVMVIEEINRGNPAQIFGEMLTLMEADKRSPEDGMALGYPKHVGERVHIPPNVYVIGTMNVADRSIALVDLALRRRFAFVDLEPVFDARWRTWVHRQCGIDLDFLTAIEHHMTSLNERIADDRSLGPQFRVGHSYVTPSVDTPISDPAEWFRHVVETEIGPLLDEYWFDDIQKAKHREVRAAGRPVITAVDAAAVRNRRANPCQKHLASDAVRLRPVPRASAGSERRYGGRHRTISPTSLPSCSPTLSSVGCAATSASGTVAGTPTSNRVRGRIDLLRTERRQLLQRGRVACSFDELTVDTAPQPVRQGRARPAG